MNKQKFVDLLRQPEAISDSSLNELEELVMENPYFHSAHTVIARASKLLRSQEAGKRVNTAAIYATSRKALKKYIQGATHFESSGGKIVEMQPNAQAKPARNISTDNITIPETFSIEPKPSLSQTEHDSLIDEVYENIEEWKKSRNQFLDYELSVEDPKDTKNVAKEPPSDVDKIKSQIAEEIIAEEEEVEQALQGIKKEKVPKPETDDDSIEGLSETTKQKEKPKLSSGNKGGKKFRLNILNRPKSGTAKKTATLKSKAGTKKTTVSTTTATKKKASTKITAAPKVKVKIVPSKQATKVKGPTAKKTAAKKKPKAKSSAVDTKKSDSEDGQKKKPKETLESSKKTKSKVDQNSLIDQFISNNPSIRTGKLKIDVEPNIDLSENSNNFPTNIVTENMAKIFESQGKTEKAVSIYEKLILKNPEKKSYFATRIKNLKK